jgi:multiple sugar transport system substrate-binding protein
MSDQRDNLMEKYAEGQLSRREFMKRGLALGVSFSSLQVFLAACGGDGGGGETGEVSGKINLLMELVPETDYVEAAARDFTKKTGVEISIEKINYAVMHNKLVPELSAGSGNGAYDVIQVDIVWPQEFVAADWIEDLSDRVASSKLVSMDDFIPAVAEATGLVNGKPYMLPFYNYAGGFLYREDLLEDQKFVDAYAKEVGGELGVPKTLQDFVKWAEFFTAATGTPGGEADIYGTVMTGRKGDNAFDWINYLYMNGGDFFQDGQPALTQPEAVESLELYVELMNKAAAPGTNATAFDEAFTLMSQGRAASFLTFLWMDVQLNDPKQSKVAGKVALSTVPGQGGSLGCWAWAIPKSAPNPDAAWKFIEYQSSFDVAKKRALMGSEPVRDDVYTDPDVLAKHPQYGVHYDIVKASKGWPPEFQNEEALQTLADEIAAVQLGQKSAADALAAVAQKVPPQEA